MDPAVRVGWCVRILASCSSNILGLSRCFVVEKHLNIMIDGKKKSEELALPSPFDFSQPSRGK